MPAQDQFLNVIDRDEAERRFHAALTLTPLGAEEVSLDSAWGRVLAAAVRSTVDVPSFDRSNVDGYALHAVDTIGASEETPRRIRLQPDEIATGMIPRDELPPGAVIGIATGGMAPRGADAVVMVEHTDVEGNTLLVRRAVAAGANLSFAGTDICAGESVLQRGELLSSRETGVLAAIGVSRVLVYRQPRVAILSTGDEIIAPGEPMRPGLVFDSNARILSDAVRELGGVPVGLGIVRDDLALLQTSLAQALAECDVVLLSGGTSKGAGDLSYRVVGQFNDPGVVAHGVALKPGKPICLAVTRGKPIVILPGFPTSAIFTFHEFVAPVIRRLANLPQQSRNVVPARLAVKVNSEIGRTEYLLVGLVEGEERRGQETCAEQAASSLARRASKGVEWLSPSTVTENPWLGLRASVESPKISNSSPSLTAYPMGKGSGSVTTFSRADGFITIGRQEELVEAGAMVEVQLLGKELQLADLVVIGSHCIGVDFLLEELSDQGWRGKFLAVGSTGGLEAAKRGDCDLAGVHLLDPISGRYNRPFQTPALELVPGYTRMQGIVFRPDDSRFTSANAGAIIERVKRDPGCLMVNRNAGSGTRILIDRLLAGDRPAGYAFQPRNHNAVAAAVCQHRADWGVCIATVAAQAGLGFQPLQAERYDFFIPQTRLHRPAVQAFLELLASPLATERLLTLGFAREDGE